MEVLSPDRNTAQNVIVEVQNAITRCKDTILKGIMNGVSEKEITKQLNKVISDNCSKIENEIVREQARDTLVRACKKWWYQLKVSFDTLQRNLVNGTSGFDLKTPPIKVIESVRNKLGSGVNKAIPIIKEYDKQVKIALKSFSADAPMYAHKSFKAGSGKIEYLSLRNSAEATVRYEANVNDLNGMIKGGVKLVWTSSHPNCSPRCKKYQGRLWSLDGSSGTIDGNKYSPIEEALKGENNDGNGIINGYNCRHRLVAYEKGSQAPKHFTEREIKKEYAIDQRQRSYENSIRLLKMEERAFRESGMIEDAKEVRIKWQKLTKAYQIYSLKNDRAYYPYRYRITDDEKHVEYIENKEG